MAMPIGSKFLEGVVFVGSWETKGKMVGWGGLVLFPNSVAVELLLLTTGGNGDSKTLGEDGDWEGVDSTVEESWSPSGPDCEM